MTFPDPDPYVFGPPGSPSVTFIQMYGTKDPQHCLKTHSSTTLFKTIIFITVLYTCTYQAQKFEDTGFGGTYLLHVFKVLGISKKASTPVFKTSTDWPSRRGINLPISDF
jgi:hypothetical protein